MGSKERIHRLKEQTRVNILDAAHEIVKDEGWQALSMRKIADKIEYTAPIIYEYYANKVAILLELTKKGFMLLGAKMNEAKTKHKELGDQIEAMWLAYWNFAFEQKEYYQLMFGVEVNCCIMDELLPAGSTPYDIAASAIAEILSWEDKTYQQRVKASCLMLYEQGRLIRDGRGSPADPYVYSIAAIERQRS